MEPTRSCRKMLIIALAAALLMACGGWWYCWWSDSIAFLPYHRGAEWIVDTRLLENEAQPAIPKRTIFKRTFFLETLPPQATLSIRVFKFATATLNGREIGGLKLDGQGWKQARTLSVAGMLRAGTNEISVSVTNYSAPPALWLRLQAGTFSLGSDEQWQSSPMGWRWSNAHLACQPPRTPPWSGLEERMNVWQSMRREWLYLTFLVVATATTIVLAGLLLERQIVSHPPKAMYVMLALVMLGRTVLWVHDAPRLAHATGFDALPHEAYIRFIQEKGTLPLPNDGWEMHQPPLYYLGGAIVMETLGLKAGDDDAVIPLRAINGVIGLLQCWLALLCLRRIFPNNLTAQALGLLVAGFLPVTICFSLYTVNDPLAALLVTLALYLFLRLLECEKENFKLAAGVGLALGLAVLAKLTAVLAVPVFLAVLGLRFLPGGAPSQRWWRSLGVVALVFVLACGWHYARVASQVGGLPMPNSQTSDVASSHDILLPNSQGNAAAGWWEDPGFRTAGYYLRFGHSLVSPLFSGWHSFADGIYSTLWADGLISGGGSLSSRPPWNYDLAYLACLAALALTLLAVVGLILFVHKFILTLEPVAGLLPGIVLAFAAGIFLLTLSSPWLASVKAFYALPALVPFSALLASGASWFAQKGRAAQMGLWFVALVWAGLVAGSFWIRTDNYEFWQRRALDELSRRDYAGAVDDCNHALQLNPGDAASRVILAQVFAGQRETSDAGREYAEALRLDPENPAALDELARLPATGTAADRQRAVQLATRACELTYWRQADVITTLAGAEIQAGQINDGVRSFEMACDPSVNTGETSGLEALAADMNNAAWLLATSPDAAQRDGQAAIQLAQRACEMTQWRKTVFVGTLAAAYAEAGKFDLAAATAQRACELAAKNGEDDLLERNRQLLERYRAHQPAREGNPR